MREIIFDNAAKGFPADEQFMRVVDENREALVSLCKGLFGDQATILSGLEIDRTGGTNPTTKIKSGYIWAFGMLLYAEERTFDGDIPENWIWVGYKIKSIMATYSNGEELPAYSVTSAHIVVNENLGPAEAFFKKYQDIKRLDNWFTNWKVVHRTTEANASISVTQTLGNINLRGVAKMFTRISADRWVLLGNVFRTTGITLPEGTQDLFAHCAIERLPQDNEPENSFADCIGVLKINRQGDLSVRVSRVYGSERMFFDNVIVHINLTFNIF